MKINLGDLVDAKRNSWLTIFIIHVMTEHTSNGNKWNEVFKLTGGNYQDAEVQVLINGVEVDFKHFIDELEKQHDRMLGDKAKELIEQHFGDLIHKLEQMQNYAELKLSDDVLPSWQKERNRNEG